MAMRDGPSICSPLGGMEKLTIEVGGICKSMLGGAADDGKGARGCVEHLCASRGMEAFARCGYRQCSQYGASSGSGTIP